MTNKDIYIHIGYPKTGTTTIQKHLFTKHEEIGYLPDSDSDEKWIYHLFYTREIPFENKLEIIQNHLLNAIKKIDNDKVKCFVYSEESLIVFSILFSFVPKGTISTNDPASIARKLKLLFGNITSGNVNIIMGIRRQDKLILSFYAQFYTYMFSKFSFTKTFQKFYTYAFEHYDHFILDTLKFYEISNYYAKLFGEEHIKILVFEKFQTNPMEYYSELFDLLNLQDKEMAHTLLVGKNENKKSLDNGYKTDRRDLFQQLNNYRFLHFPWLNFPRFLIELCKRFYTGGKIDTMISLSENETKKIQKFYELSNKKLSEKYNLNLSKYGYYTEKES